MVIINLKGGLGNQLFQYASGLAVAQARKQDLVFDIQSFEKDPYGRTYALKPFKVDTLIYSKEQVDNVLGLSLKGRLVNFLKSKESKRYFSLGDLELDLSILNSNPQNQYLNGYFANPNYFEVIGTELFKKISLKEEFITPAFKETIEWIKKNKFISIHIRRADYVSDQGANQLFETLVKDYYERCIDYFRSEIVCSKKFLFFSDELDWVKKEFKDLPHAYFIEEKELYKDFYDLIFMAACEHNIIANSTFSWWGAWLNNNPDKIVLAPRKWYRNATYQAFYEKSNFIPKSWLLK